MDDHEHDCANPNGPVRHEPYVQAVNQPDGPLWGPGLDRYRYSDLPAHDPDRALAHDPDDDWDVIADGLYPGLREAVTAAAA